MGTTLLIYTSSKIHPKDSQSSEPNIASEYHDVQLRNAALLSRINIERRSARESIDLRVHESFNETLAGSVCSKSRHRKRSQKVNEVPSVEVPSFRKETSNESLQATVVVGDLSSSRIVPFTRQHGVLLDEVSECK